MTIAAFPVKKIIFHVAQNTFVAMGLVLFVLLALEFIYPRLKEEISLPFILLWDAIFCFLFFAYALFRFIVNLRKKHYSVFLGFGFDLICAIPWMIDPTQVFFFSVLRLVSISRMLFLPEIQDYFEPFLKEAYKVFIVAVLVFSIALSAAMAVYGLESHHPLSSIHTPKEALWWALVTMTTVGYGDYVPASGNGRLVAGFLMASGIGVFGLVASLVTQPFLKALQRRQEESHQTLSRELSSRLLEVSGQIVRLHEENEELIGSISLLHQHQSKINNMLNKLDQVTSQQDYLLANMSHLLKNLSLSSSAEKTAAASQKAQDRRPEDKKDKKSEEDILEEYIREASLRR